ncbi:aminoglycoside phosphotransferase family protein [Sinomonas sp. JGH33]|uniref:Aminoglycoside phosphotransferase family protein n=1 Tax=Sinomonas terricola TaxID=3110330 RepID=A0ABU5TAH9_9MICC|nr:aminoglycoside phosphotransferase family protein [Sinomonas sp. JGH33]MEA5456667.1 aminoglycoside phosphotransferase family protein [Sinomonas sp. JGH33]
MAFIDRLLRDHYDELRLFRYGVGRTWDTVLVTPRFVTSRHVVGLVFAIGAREPSLVVKIPRQPGDNYSVRHEASVIGQLNALGIGREQGVPEVIKAFDVGDHTVLLETAVIGSPLDPQRVVADLASAVHAGTEFVAALPCTAAAAVNVGWYERTVGRSLSGLASLLPQDSAMTGLVERTHELLEPMRSVPLPAVVEHGDLSHPNLIVRPNGRLQAVDWERSRTDGLPGHDLVFYLQYLSESSERAFERADQMAAFDKAFGPEGWAREPVRRHLQRRGVDPALLPLLVLATWARSAATLAFRLEGQTATEQGMAETRAAVLADRDYWLWRHAVETMSPRQGFPR